MSKIPMKIFSVPIPVTLQLTPVACKAEPGPHYADWMRIVRDDVKNIVTIELSPHVLPVSISYWSRIVSISPIFFRIGHILIILVVKN